MSTKTVDTVQLKNIVRHKNAQRHLLHNSQRHSHFNTAIIDINKCTVSTHMTMYTCPMTNVYIIRTNYVLNICNNKYIHTYVHDI